MDSIPNQDLLRKTYRHQFTMKKILKYSLGFAFVAIATYFSGPKPAKPRFNNVPVILPDSLVALEQQINAEEKVTKGIRPDCEARIVWADSAKKEKTAVAFLYIHGFSASQEEGDPVHTNLAKKYGANLYLARLAGHGIDLGDNTMKDLTTDELIQSAEKSLAIAQKLGQEVVVVSTSFGSALTLYLASKHPEIKAIVLYSPCIKVFDPKAELLDNHWGLHLAKLVTGSYIRDFKPQNPNHQKYWSTHYHLNGAIALQNFLTNVMTPETFAQVKCPTFVGYYYRNEQEQDNVVSVKAMLEMYQKLGVASQDKRLVNFPKAGYHVIASYVLSKDIEGVEQQTTSFLKEVVGLKP